LFVAAGAAILCCGCSDDTIGEAFVKLRMRGDNTGNTPDGNGAPDAPTNVTAYAQSSNSIMVSWYPVGEAAGYNVYRSTNSYGDYNYVRGSIYAASYMDSDLSSNTAYYYKVSAYNSYGESSLSYSYDWATTYPDIGTDTATNPPGTIVYDTLYDDRDGQKYKTVSIGGQTWMAQNLNYETALGSQGIYGAYCDWGPPNEWGEGGCWPVDDEAVLADCQAFGNGVFYNSTCTLRASYSWCYGGDESNCERYGRLYDWNTAMMGLPSSASNPSGIQGICPDGWHLPSNEEWGTLVSYAGESAGTKLKAISGWNSGGSGTDNYGFSALPGGFRDSNGYFGGAGSYGYWWTATAGYRHMSNNSDVSYNNSGDNAMRFSVRCVKD
jgi:uncharacterized protein (TIGR02145 family)